MIIKMNEPTAQKSFNDFLLENAKNNPGNHRDSVKHTASEMIEYILGDSTNKRDRVVAMHVLGLAREFFMEGDRGYKRDKKNSYTLVVFLGGCIEDGDMMQRFFNVTEYMAGRVSSIYMPVDRETTQILREIRSGYARYESVTIFDEAR